MSTLFEKKGWIYQEPTGFLAGTAAENAEIISAVLSVQYRETFEVFDCLAWLNPGWHVVTGQTIIADGIDCNGKRGEERIGYYALQAPNATSPSQVFLYVTTEAKIYLASECDANFESADDKAAMRRLLELAAAEGLKTEIPTPQNGAKPQQAQRCKS